MNIRQFKNYCSKRGYTEISMNVFEKKNPISQDSIIRSIIKNYLGEYYIKTEVSTFEFHDSLEKFSFNLHNVKDML